MLHVIGCASILSTELDPTTAYALWAAHYPPRAHNPLMQAEERAMLALIPASLRRLSVLDAGCGSGRYLRHAQQRGARRLLGVDLSAEMLAQARTANKRQQAEQSAHPPRLWAALIQASLAAIPLRDSWADLTLCSLTLGHLEDLYAPLAELRRVTRPGGTILCSDFHPIGHALGWQRAFTVDGQRYAVRHTAHLYSHWHHVCRDLNLRIVHVQEPRLDPADIPADATVDPRARDVPVALVFELRRER